jgi:lysophospholipase L1-like esterase
VKRLLAVWRGLGLLLMNTLVLLLFIEIAAGGVSWFISEPEDVPDILDSNVRDWRSLPYYADQPWAADYWAEAENLTVQFAPFLIWRTAQINGAYINASAGGTRITPGADCDGDAFRVFAMGGSTMWGAGAPDFGTIPAYLVEGLQTELDAPVCVINFGQAAAVTTQGVIELMLRLQNDDIPDLIIFYAGINEVQAAYETGAGDLHQSYTLIAGRYHDPSFEYTSFGAALGDGLRDVSYAARLLGRLSPENESGIPSLSYATMGIGAELLAAQTVDTLRANYEMVEALATAYGFDFAFFWQPVLAVEVKPLTPEEVPLQNNLDPALVALYEATYDAVPSDYAKFYDIRDALADERAQIYIDEFHITPDGNRIVADRMLEILREDGFLD